MSDSYISVAASSTTSSAAISSTTAATDLQATATPSNSPSSITQQSSGYYSNLTSSSPTLGTGVSAGVASGALAALPIGFKTSVSEIADFQLGTYLSRNGTVSGSTGSIINGVINFIKSGNSTTTSDSINNQNFKISSTFIPIVIQTEFNLAGTSNTSTTTSPSPLYILFQSTPDSISFSKSANWNQKDFYGRPEPVQIFASSSPVTFSLAGTFFADSAGQLSENINLEKQLFALVTPSKNHFMPSPVKVKIGNWKALRCITTSMSIDFQGPWYVPVTSSTSSGSSSLLSHSPYIYYVTFNFTVTSQQNSVQYAEDIVDYGFNGGIEQTNSSTLGEYNTSFNPVLTSPDFFAGNSTATYDDSTGEITYSVVGTAGGVGTVITQSGQFNTAQYLQNLGLPTTANNSQSIAALGSITSGLTAVVQTTINKNYGSRISKALGS
jgi:hypothetical protein